MDLTASSCNDVVKEITKVADSLRNVSELLDQETVLELSQKFKDTKDLLLKCSTISEIRHKLSTNYDMKRSFPDINSAIFDKDIEKIENILNSNSNEILLYPSSHTGDNEKIHKKNIEAEINSTFSNIVTDINEKINVELPNYTPNIIRKGEWNKLEKSIENITKPSEEEDELVLVSTGITENQIYCPYTSKIMNEPYRNTRDTNCKHHVSLEGLKHLTKKSKRGRCPFPGCTCFWEFGCWELDRAFQEEINIYLKRKREQDLS